MTTRVVEEAALRWSEDLNPDRHFITEAARLKRRSNDVTAFLAGYAKGHAEAMERAAGLAEEAARELFKGLREVLKNMPPLEKFENDCASVHIDFFTVLEGHVYFAEDEAIIALEAALDHGYAKGHAEATERAAGLCEKQARDLAEKMHGVYHDPSAQVALRNIAAAIRSTEEPKETP